MSKVTQILDAMNRGDAKAAGELLPIVYEELRRLAAAKMAKEAPGQTLQPTALVHEAWLRIVDPDLDSKSIESTEPQFQNRAHFYAAAAEAMRRILIERARRRKAIRHGGGQQRMDWEGVEIQAPAPDEELLAVNDALDRFAKLDAEKAEFIKLRYFAGMTLEDAAGTLRFRNPRQRGGGYFRGRGFFVRFSGGHKAKDLQMPRGKS